MYIFGHISVKQRQLLRLFYQWFRIMPYIMQQTQEIPNQPPQVGAKHIATIIIVTIQVHWKIISKGSESCVPGRIG